MTSEGRLPVPRGRPPATVARALDCYDRAARGTTLAARRRAHASLMMYLQGMTKDDLAHYYAAVRRRYLAD